MGRRLAFATIHTVDKILVDVAFTDTFLENGGGYIFPVNHIISTHAILSLFSSYSLALAQAREGKTSCSSPKNNKIKCSAIPGPEILASRGHACSSRSPQSPPPGMQPAHIPNSFFYHLAYCFLLIHSASFLECDSRVPRGVSRGA